MKKMAAALCLISCVIVCSPIFSAGVIASEVEPIIMNKPQDAEISEIVKGNTAFALDLYAKLKNHPKVAEQKGNVFFSPYSVSSALAMTWAGAKLETASQMAEVLHFTLGKDRTHQEFAALTQALNEGGEEGHYQLRIVNALWGQQGYGFLQSFLDETEKYYGAGLKPVDFANATEKTRQTINAWVEEQTEGKIKELIGEGVLTPLVRLVLTNAIYFQGNWETQFNEENTHDAPFTVTPEQKVTVPMMYMKEDLPYGENDEVQVLELPYKENDLSMMVLLPQKIDGLETLEDELTPETLAKWLNLLRIRPVKVYLPKFKMTSGPFKLKDTLKEMGMIIPFEMNADFSGMTGKKDLYISHVLHKAFVDVNETGTEAAAATAVVMELKAMIQEEPVFRADHPFLFIIKDNHSGSILFIGRVMNPEA